VFEGLLVFGVSVALLLVFDALISRLLPTPEVEREDRKPPASGGTPAGACYGQVLATVAAVFALASVALPRWHPPAPAAGMLELPVEVGSWRRTATKEPLWTPVDSGSAVARYELAGETVLVFMARDRRLRRNSSLLSPRNVVPGPGWEIEKRWLAEPEAGSVRFQAVLAGSFASRSLTYSTYEGLEGVLGEVVRATFATDRSFLRRPGEAKVLRLSTNVTPSARGATDAEARLEAFLRAWREMHRRSR
jgi:hypothetical protein